MSTLLISHADCLGHEPGPHHPESPDRLRAVMQALKQPRFDALIVREAPLGDIADIERVHPGDYARLLLGAVPDDDLVAIDSDTIVSPGSGDAALRAVGAVTSAVDAVLSGEVDNAFCAVRPPGHHAEPERAMGFCLFNNIAIGALHACAIHGLDRVAIVDFDVHHGNGTQALAERDPRLFYVSSHQYPFYPGTGAASETGQGNVLNRPLRAGTESLVFRQIYERDVVPTLLAFEPQLLMISAGFDAHKHDPLGGLALDESDFAWVTQTLKDVAATTCQGRIVSVLEGGYNLSALARSAAAHVSVLAGLAA